MRPRVVATPVTRPSAISNAGDFAILDDVDAATIGGAGKSPDHGVVAGGAAAALEEAAADREAGVGEIEIGEQRADSGFVEQLGIDAVEAHGVAAAAGGVALRRPNGRG